MSNSNNDSNWEHVKEIFDEDPADALVCDEQALVEFFLFCKEKMPKAMLEKCINEWLATAEGLKFYSRALNSLYESNYPAIDGPEHD